MIPAEDPLNGPAQPPDYVAERGAAPREQASVEASEQYAGTSLRLQALEIIGSLLNSTRPELEEARSCLRRHVQAHPWDPEIALLLHLWDRAQLLVTPWEVILPPMQPPSAIQSMNLPPPNPPENRSGVGPLPA
ncbi:hypothetical protein [Arthrobacter sp. CG_A4]|uniref:hypothetical protein n=1 Tax=Arthrobacter sp. CG_A4 TaxID=3071706 RepID=UPI002E07B4E8|nr:hypothetical protein [Arthrobacter sp. CG_A4]